MAESFLSEAWLSEVESIRSSVDGLMMPPGAADLRVNLTITDDAVGDGSYHITGAPGGLAIHRGHVEGATATVSMPYGLAKAMFVDQDQQAVMQGWTSGDLKVDGDMSRLMPLAQSLAVVDAKRREFDERVKATTA